MPACSAIRNAEAAGRVVGKGAFVWPTAFVFERVHVPVPGEGQTYRDIGEIPPEEVDLALLRVAEAALGIDHAHLRTQVARILGFDRTGGNVGDLIDSRIAANLQNGSLQADDAWIVLRVELPRLPTPALATSFEADEPTEKVDGFSQGQLVKHPRYGVGTVQDVGPKYVTVAFADVVKEFDPELAHIRLVSEE